MRVEDLAPYLTYLWERAQNLLKQPGHWAGVDALAIRLSKVEELDYDEATTIVSSSVRKLFREHIKYIDSHSWCWTGSPALAHPRLCELI